ncbi:MAG TPA: PstS family phosphate ABC transporter substrate-binding protein [Actinomycetota bacterium]|jgi:phosphate transport system substrate-binding protein|nr:PstS family phosphate ABC transporter substrate-binding protein [Actinomycetota bacterium]
MRARTTVFAATAVAVTLLATGCGGTAGRGGGLSGSIAIDGSSTVFPITQAVAEEFNTEEPGVQISVGTSGTGGGFEKFCAGETDISDASRPIEQEEAAICEQNGIEYVELQVAIDGLSVMVNPQNTFAQCLTVEELKAIWEPESTINNWSEVRDGFPDQPLTLYGPGTDSGTFDYFTDAIVGEEGASRSDYTPSEDDNVLVQGIAGDPNALGYFGYAYYVQNQDKLKLLGVDAGSGCVTATEETVASGEYTPLSRPLFIYVAKEAAGRPEVQSFVDFYLATVNELIADVGYIAVPEETLQTEIGEWEQFAA